MLSGRFSSITTGDPFFLIGNGTPDKILAEQAVLVAAWLVSAAPRVAGGPVLAGKTYIRVQPYSSITCNQERRWRTLQLTTGTPVDVPGEVGDDGDQLVRANWLRHMYLEA